MDHGVDAPDDPCRHIEKYGGAHGVLDENVVGSALARPRNLWSYDEGADLSDLAAAYLVGFTAPGDSVMETRGTGLACALVFLALTGFEIRVLPKELFALFMRVALGEGDDRLVSAYLRERITPRS